MQCKLNVPIASAVAVDSAVASVTSAVGFAVDVPGVFAVARVSAVDAVHPAADFPSATDVSNFSGSRALLTSLMLWRPLKVHKIEIFFGFDFEICIISLLVMSKY